VLVFGNVHAVLQAPEGQTGGCSPGASGEAHLASVHRGIEVNFTASAKTQS